MQGGQLVPVQRVLRFPHTSKVGPKREGPDYSKVGANEEALESRSTLQETKEQIQEDIDEAYVVWRKLAVDEALQADDIVPSTVPENLRKIAGSDISIRWDDSTKAATT